HRHGTNDLAHAHDIHHVLLTSYLERGQLDHLAAIVTHAARSKMRKIAAASRMITKRSSRRPTPSIISLTWCCMVAGVASMVPSSNLTTLVTRSTSSPTGS